MKRLTGLPLLVMTLGIWYRSNRAGASRSRIFDAVRSRADAVRSSRALGMSWPFNPAPPQATDPAE